MAATGNYHFLGDVQHGLLAFPAWRNGGQIFAGGNQSVDTVGFTAGLTTTYTGGLFLYNPPTSTVNLSVLKVSYGFLVAHAAAAIIGVAVAQSLTALTAPGTAVASVCTQVGSANTPQGILYSPTSATLPVAPKLVKVLTSVDTGAITTQPGGFLTESKIDGEILLLPGGLMAFVSTATGTPSSFIGAISWEEIP
jgi:hypothetical protein